MRRTGRPQGREPPVLLVKWYDVTDRLRRHNAGHNKATKHGVPWELLHTEPFPTRSEAVLRERHCKTGRGRDELDRMLG